MEDVAVPDKSGSHAFIAHLAHVRTKDHPAYRNRGAAGETLTPPDIGHRHADPEYGGFTVASLLRRNCRMWKMVSAIAPWLLIGSFELSN
jgi:hypothetical protein